MLLSWAQDAFERLNLSGDQLRGRIRIQYVDHFGEVEAGVDGGGLFKDFMENLVKEGFDPQVRVDVNALCRSSRPLDRIPM